ncbi:MAG: DotH/IcmK family type IV secretion protein [Gammaproteobacteria bacterium]|jgi:intracellular multiplication protein IcmK
MIRLWITGIISLILLLSVAYAQAQPPVQAAQVNLPPLANTQIPPSNMNPHNAANAVANKQPAITPQQAMNDPQTEEHYFEESTYGTAKDPAFENMLKKMYPMTPEQIQALRQAHETTQRAMEAPAQPVPEPTVTSQSVSLAPGTTPPVLRLSTGYVSSVVFLDETGAPWPVSAYSIGNPNNFNIQWDQKSNLLLIQGQKSYATGNMAVTLHGMNTPVMLTIVTDQGQVDYRVDYRIQGRGPNARGSIMGSAVPQNASATLINLLDGIAPQDSEMLSISGGDAQVWLWNNQLYVRTPLTLLSPGWTATLSSADGTHVYQLPVTPMILASQRGESITLKVEGL